MLNVKETELEINREHDRVDKDLVKLTRELSVFRELLNVVLRDHSGLKFISFFTFHFII